MSKVDFLILDQKTAILRLKNVTREQLRAAKQALYEWAENTMADSKELCPIDTGNLCASGHVQGRDGTPRFDEDPFEVFLSYGGPAGSGPGQKEDVGYAIPVHENLAARHNPPTQAKYLETPVKQNTGDLLKEIADAVKSIR